MAGFNKVLLMGNLTRDPQLSYTPSQTAVVDFGLAVNRRWTSKGGESKEETCFVDCRAFGRQAENINKYLTKGRPVFVEGRLTFDSWTSQDGTKRSRHRVTAETFQFLPGTAGAPPETDETSASSAAPIGGEGAGQDTDAGSATAPDKNFRGEGKDDIPF
jgi:single-strand DNA-binding protein